MTQPQQVTVHVVSKLGTPSATCHVGSVAASVEHALHQLRIECPSCGHLIDLQAVQHGFVASHLTRPHGAEDDDDGQPVRVKTQLAVDAVPLWQHLRDRHGWGWFA